MYHSPALVRAIAADRIDRAEHYRNTRRVAKASAPPRLSAARRLVLAMRSPTLRANAAQAPKQ